MNTHFLHIPDAPGSRTHAASSETDDLHNTPNHTLSQRRDEQIHGDAKPKDELERRNDANHGVEYSVNLFLDAMEENDSMKQTGPRSPFSNVGPGTREAPPSFPNAKSQNFNKLTSQSTGQDSISTIHPIEHSQKKKHTSCIPSRGSILTNSASGSINIPPTRRAFLQPASRNGPAGLPSKPSVAQINSAAFALSTLKTTARIQEGTQLNAENRTPPSSAPCISDPIPTRTGESAHARSSVTPMPETVSAPSPAGQMPIVVSNTVLGPHRMGVFSSSVGVSPRCFSAIASHITPEASNSFTHSRDKTKHITLQKTIPLVTQNVDNPISRPNAPPQPIHTSPKAPQYPIPHSPVSSPSCSNTIQEPPLSAPPSPTLPINPSLKELCDYTSGDGYTSADADGESIATCDSFFELIESSIDDTLPTHSTNVASTTLQSSKQPSHKSVYDLFTPPLTRQSSQVPSQHAEQESTPQTAPRSRLFMSHVEVPPLPKGANKLEYRPLKRAKRTHDVEYSLGNESPTGWGRESHGANARARGIRQQSRPRTIRSSSVLSMATTASSHGRQAAQSKSILPKPSLPPPLQRKTPGKDSTVRRRINTMTSATATYPSSPLSLLNFEVPSPSQHDTEMQRVHDAEHLPPVVAYFNARHYQLCPREDPTSWILLGAQILMNCLGPKKLSCVREMNLDDDVDEVYPVNYSVGGPLSWEGCSDDGKAEKSLMSRSQKGRRNMAAGSGWGTRKPNSSVMKQRELSQTRNVTQPLATPVSKLDLAKALKEKTSITRRKQMLKRDMTMGRASGPAETPDTTEPAVFPSQSQPQPQPQSQSQSQPQPQSQPRSQSKSKSQSRPQPQRTLTTAFEQPAHLRPYLSEKARGKQRAVDSNPVEPDFHGDLRSLIRPSPTTVQGLLDVDALTPTPNSPPWPRPIEEYITFDASPAKIGGGSSSGDAGYIPNLPYAPYDTHDHPPTRTNIDDLFLPPPDVEPSIFGSGINLMEGIDAYHTPYGIPMNVEKEVLPTTVNPSLLGGNTYDNIPDDEVGLTLGVTSLMDDSDGMGMEDKRLPDVTEHGERLLEMKTEYELSLGSPILSTARLSSTSSSNVSPRSSQSPSTPVLSRSISVTLLGRTSSPEFSDYNVPSRVSLSPSSGISRSIKLVRSAASFPRQNSIVSSEGEREEVRRGLEYTDALSTSDEEFIPLSDLENESEDVDHERPTSLRSKRKTVLSSSPDSTPAPTTVNQSFRGRPDWECGPIRSCCHYCRMSSNKLKMLCPCGLRYCNRCVALRFPDIEFRSKWDSSGCPVCKNQCTCDYCTKKRGEVYIPRRRNKEISSRTTPVIRHRRPRVQLPVERSSSPQFTRLPSPENVETTENLSFWGSIYDINGNKIAVGFADEDNEVVIANPIQGYTRPEVAESVSEDDWPATRTFVGAYQPSWGLGSAPIIKDLGGHGRMHRINDEDADGADFRWYIGKESLLYRSVAARTRDLPINIFSDMSSLSSLSDDSDVEVDDNPPLPVAEKVSTSPKNDTKDEEKGIAKVDPHAIQARDTVHILQLIARDICGIMSNVEQSLINI